MFLSSGRISQPRLSRVGFSTQRDRRYLCYDEMILSPRELLSVRAVGAGAEGLEPEDGVSPPRAGQGGWGWRICPLPLRDGAAQALQQHRGRAGRLSPGARGAAGGAPLERSLDRFLREPTWRRLLPAAGKAREPRGWRHASARITWRRAGVTRAASPAGKRRPQPERTGEGPGGAGGEVAALRGPPRALGGAYRPAELR